MNIQPTVRIFENTSSNVVDQNSINLIELPELNSATNIDADYMDAIRNQPLPNNLQAISISDAKNEIADLINLLGSFCANNSIEQIKGVIDQIHAKLNNKPPHLIRSWVRLIKGLHPKIDEYIQQNKGFFKNPFSDLVGTNTIMYYADESAIDIWYWSKVPKYKNNTVEWFLDPWIGPTYLRESIREKVPSDVVNYIQKANFITTTAFRRNIIFDAITTTADGTGGDTKQARPIEKNVAHGSSLNNDWYHQTYRIFGARGDKYWSKQDAIYKLDEPDNGYLVHLLVNYITPLTPISVVNNKRIVTQVEETFPNSKPNLSVSVGNNNQKILDNSTAVDDSSIVPEKTII